MAENKKSFVAYADWKNTFDMLSDDEAGKLIKHLLNYVNDETAELEDRLLKLAFEPIKLQLKRDLKQWEDIRKKRAEAGKKGGENSGKVRSKTTIKKANEANALSAKQKKANEAVNDNVTVTVNVNDNVTVNSIKERKLKFASTLKDFEGKYPKDMLNDFYRYWTEENKSGSKFKRELEKTWDLSRRLDTWAKNDKNFNHGKTYSNKSSGTGFDVNR